jgi:sec-independent protein translocase protein TatB
MGVDRVFGLSMEHLLLLLVAALFILGPERLPAAAEWLGKTVRRARDFTANAHEQVRSELGPEFDELRKPLQDLNSLRNIGVNTAVVRYLADDNSAASPSAAGPAANGTQGPPASTDRLLPHPDQVPSPGPRRSFDEEAT